MIRTFYPHLLSIALSVPVLTGSGTVWAAAGPSDGKAPDREVVELDAQANAAYQAGAFESAAKLFRKLHEVTKDPNYLYNLAVCYDRLDRLEEAIGALDEYAAKSAEHDEEAVAAKRRGLEIRLETASRDVNRDEEPSDEAPAPSTSEAVDTDSGNGRTMSLDIAGGVALGLGVASLGVGIGLGVTSNRHKSALADGCVTGDTGLLCLDGGRDDSDKAQSFALGADISIILGGVLVAGGVAVLAVNTVRAKKKRGGGGTMSVAPAFGRRLTGVALSGRF